MADNRLTDLSYFNPEKLIEMAMSVDEDVPGMGTIKEMIMQVNEEPIFEPGEDDLDDAFKNTLVFNLSPEDYGRFIKIKVAAGFKEADKDEEIFLAMLDNTEKELGIEAES